MLIAGSCYVVLICTFAILVICLWSIVSTRGWPARLSRCVLVCLVIQQWSSLWCRYELPPHQQWPDKVPSAPDGFEDGEQALEVTHAMPWRKSVPSSRKISCDRTPCMCHVLAAVAVPWLCMFEEAPLQDLSD